MSFILRDKISFLGALIIFIVINSIVVSNLGLFNDDWLFYSLGDQSFSEWAIRVWNGEGGVIRRHIVAPIYIILHLIPVKIAYSISIFLSLILFYLFFLLLIKLILKNFIIKNKEQLEINLLLLICAWYFFPFNIGGQFWITAIIHTKISTILFLLNIIFLVQKKYLIALIFLALSFNSYEIFFFLYLPITLIFYFGKLIEKKIFKKYLIVSFIIQLFFLFDKIRPGNADHDLNNVDIIELIIKSTSNLGRFLYSIYQTIPENLNINLKVSLCIVMIFCFYLLFKKIHLLKNKSFFYTICILLFISLCLNSAVNTLGTYGYWGKGIFSRTMFIPSFLILFFLCISISIINKKISLYFSGLILILSLASFNIEIKNWINSSRIQNEIINSKIFSEKNELFKNKSNIIFFEGPCYINGVEIFNATWDLNSGIRFLYPELAKNNFLPIQDWKLSVDKNEILSIHIFEFNLNDYEEIYYWNYFNDTLIKMNKKTFNKESIDIFKSRRDCNIGINERKKAKNTMEFVSEHIPNYLRQILQ